MIDKYWSLVGNNRFKVSAMSDGTCQADAKTTAIIGFKDPEIKIQLAEAENKYLIQNQCLGFGFFDNLFWLC